MLRWALILLIGLSEPLLLFAQTEPSQNNLEYTPPVMPDAPNFLNLLARMIGLTIFACVIVLGVVWWAKKSQKAKLGPQVPERLQVVQQLRLDRHSQLHTLHVDGQEVVVSTDQTGLRSMMILQEPIHFDELLDEAR